MFFSIRHKLALTSVIVFTIIFLTLGVYLSNYFASDYRESLEASLLSDASLAAGFVDDLQPAKLAAVVSRLGDNLDLRVTVVDLQGVPLAETDTPVDEMENHIDRPEVQSALQGNAATSKRYSATLGMEMLYGAAPIYDDQGEIVAVFRLSQSLEQVDQAVADIRRIIFVAMFSGLLVAGVATGIVAGFTTRSVAILSKKARDFGQGVVNTRREVDSNDEIGHLEQVFNEMAENIVSVMSKSDQERTRVEHILHQLPVGVLVVARDGTLVAANTAAREILGTDSEAQGKQLSQFSRNYQVNQFVMDLLAEKRHKQTEVELAGKNDDVSYIQLRGAALGEDNREAVVVLQDVSGLRHLEQNRRDLVANISHELRTPLTAIRGFAETLLEGQLDDETVRNFLDIIRTESLRMSRMLNDLLNLSRLESGIKRKEGHSSVSQVAGDVIRLFGELATAKDIKFSVDVQEDIEVAVERDYLEQVLMNYIDNAIRYTPRGTKVTVRAERLDNGFVNIAVSDDGPGIPESDQAKVFQRFYRVEKSRQREAGGTGLGLAIVRHLVEGFGGQVGVVSNPRTGTSFWATLPGRKKAD